MNCSTSIALRHFIRYRVQQIIRRWELREKKMICERYRPSITSATIHKDPMVCRTVYYVVVVADSNLHAMQSTLREHRAPRIDGNYQFWILIRGTNKSVIVN